MQVMARSTQLHNMANVLCLALQAVHDFDTLLLREPVHVGWRLEARADDEVGQHPVEVKACLMPTLRGREAHARVSSARRTRINTNILLGQHTHLYVKLVPIRACIVWLYSSLFLSSTDSAATAAASGAAERTLSMADWCRRPEVAAGRMEAILLHARCAPGWLPILNSHHTRLVQEIDQARAPCRSCLTVET